MIRIIVSCHHKALCSVAILLYIPKSAWGRTSYYRNISYHTKFQTRILKASIVDPPRNFAQSPSWYTFDNTEKLYDGENFSGIIFTGSFINTGVLNSNDATNVTLSQRYYNFPKNIEAISKF